MTLVSLDHIIVRHSLTHVKELVGNPGVLNVFKTILEKPDKKNTAKVIYQLNLGSRSTQSTPKPVSSLINAKSWGKRYPKEKGNWDGICWITIESSLEKFLQFVELGFPYRLGIKEGGNSQRHYKGNQGIAFDLDNNSEITLEQTKTRLEELELTGIIHYSPSGNSENNKFRLILFFDQFVENYSRVNHLVKCLGSLLPNNANNVHDPGRFFYGTILPIAHTDYQVNDFKFLYAKYSQILEYVEEKPSQTPLINLENVDPSGLTIPQRFGLKLSQWFEQTNECLGNLISKICEHFDLTLDNWHLHDSPGTNIEQWRGLDPIHPEQSTTGSSFTVYHAENGTYAYKADRVGAYGDLIDLWFRFSHHAWDINGGVNSRHKQSYWKAFREFCEFLDVDWIKEFDSEQPKEEKKEVTPESTKEAKKTTTTQQTIDIKTISVEEAKQQVQILKKEKPVMTWNDCYVAKKDRYSLDVTKCARYFIQEHKNKFYYDTVQGIFWLKQNNVWRRKNVDDFNGYVVKFIENQENLHNEYVEFLMTHPFLSGLRTWFKNLSEEYHAKNLEPSWNYIGCKNGVFDIKTKELLPYPSEAFITHILPYTRKKHTGLGITTLRSFLEQFFDDHRCIDDFLLWVAGVVQQRGFKTRQAVALVGDSGAGKSDLTNLITSLVSPSSVNLFDQEPNFQDLPEYEIVITKHLRPYQILSDNNQFNLQHLEHQRLVVFPEFTGFTKDSLKGSDFLKNLISDSNGYGYRISSPVKYANESRDFYFRGAIITNSQEYPKLQSEDDGISRRFMFIKVNRIKENQPELFKALQNFEVLEDLWNYFLDFRLEPIYERMKELSSSRCTIPWKVDSTIFMNQANNLYWKYAKDKLEVIKAEDIKDDEVIPSVAAKAIYESYKNWSRDQGETYVGTQTAFGLGITKAIAMLAKTSFDKIKKRTAKGVVYQYIRIKVDCD